MPIVRAASEASIADDDEVFTEDGKGLATVELCLPKTTRKDVFSLSPKNRESHLITRER